MYLIRESFIAKPGSAGKLAQMLKEGTPPVVGKVTVMVDMAADFNTVVIEHTVEHLADFEKMMDDFKNKPELRAKMTGYTDLYMTGKREMFRVL